MTEITEEQVARLIKMQKDSEEKITQAQRDENKGKMNELMADPAKLQAAMEEDAATFAAADTDGDGRLNHTEFVDFCSKQEANAIAKGWHMAKSTDEEIEAWWNIMLEITKETSSVTKEQYDTIQGRMMEAYMAQM